MTAKKILAILTIFLIITVFSVGTSHAGWYYNMEIVKIGQQANGVLLKIKNATGTINVQRLLDQTNEKNLLAMALTAQSLTSSIHVQEEGGVFVGIVISNE